MASTIKQRLRRYNGTDYDTIHLETQESQIIADYTKYAPAGYGLGGMPRSLPNRDCNQAIETGWYQSGATSINYPNEISRYGFLRVMNRPSYVLHEYTSVVDNVSARRVIDTSLSSPSYDWEYENPPLSSGTRYRTTERFAGKPVYAYYNANIGTLPETGTEWSYTYPTALGNIDNIVCGEVLDTEGRNLTNNSANISVIFAKSLLQIHNVEWSTLTVRNLRMWMKFTLN